MERIKIALVQIKAEKGQIYSNLDQIESYIQKSKDNNADIVCFPEMSITGYINPMVYPEAVLSLENPPIKHFIELSKKYSILVIAGFVEKNPDGKPYITQLAALNGELRAVYRKINVAEDEMGWFSCGREISVFLYNGIHVGLTVCADIDKDSIFDNYASAGVKLIFECAAPGLYGDQETRNWSNGYNWWRSECYGKLGTYAKKNGIYIAVSTQAGRTVDEDFPGGGYVFSPEGTCISETPDWNESVLYTQLAI